jgi:8-oxo-dGTP diphosphatase
MNNPPSNYLLCSTVYVMNSMRNFLLFKHPKFMKWVPPGGKIEPNEMPQDAAIRECFEETGIRIHLLGNKSPLEQGLIAQHGMEYNPAEGACKAHLDFIYFAKAIPDQEMHPGEGEIGWFSLSEISKLDTFPSIFKWCSEFEGAHY